MRSIEMGTKYPTIEHELAAGAITDFFAATGKFEAVLLVNSCARGKATRDSCLDINVLARPEVIVGEGQNYEEAWARFYKEDEVFKALRNVGKFSEVHLDITDGQFKPVVRDWEGGPDGFELEIGNALVYSVPLWESSDYFRQLKAKWLPYYDEELRCSRLQMASRYVIHNLDHIPLYVERGLYFQSLSRLWDAFRDFLQALFISRRTYPIAYDKWIREQVVEILGLPELYARLPGLFEIRKLESRELVDKAEALRRLFGEYVQGEG